jgi:RNA 2',3'-cyclic 3'-phosphodiesterase
VRTFIAVPLPQDCHRLLSRLQSEMRAMEADVRWTAVPSIHLTLKFLGEIDPDLVPKLAPALRSATASFSPFGLSLRGLGGFPNLRSPRVLWCGIEGDTEGLHRLQNAVEQTCASFGFEPEAREFHPHLTLGRVQGKRNLQRVLDYIKIGSDFEQPFAVDRVHLYRSVLTPRGANYSVLETIELIRKPIV